MFGLLHFGLIISTKSYYYCSGCSDWALPNQKPPHKGAQAAKSRKGLLTHDHPENVLAKGDGLRIIVVPVLQGQKSWQSRIPAMTM